MMTSERAQVSSSVGTEERTRHARRVAVIGAGAAGLTAAKALRDAGMPPVVFEASDDVGGLWLYDEREPGARAAYRSLRTNTSKQITAFSDAPFPNCLPDFPSRSDVERYLRDYAVRFSLLPLIRFRHEVRAVRPEETGTWRVTVAHNGVESDEQFDAVLVCAGIFRRPAMPIISGLDRLQVSTLHSLDYGRPEVFAGSNVLVVGLGSSAADIAADLVGTAGSVTLSTRRGAWITPKVIGGRPRDHAGTRLSTLLPRALRDRTRDRALADEYGRLGLPSPDGVWRAARVPFDGAIAPVVSSNVLLPAMVSGQIGIRPGIECVEEREIMFVDGSRLRPDAVIFATGYDLDFSFLPQKLRPWSDGGGGLYRLVFPPDHPTLAFIGVCRAHGPIFPMLEMQARWATRVLLREVALPPRDIMRAEIDERIRMGMERHDSVIRVPLLPYLDELGSLIGARPQLWRHPLLVRALLTGPPVAAQYRLQGPDRWKGAAVVMRSSHREGKSLG